jgi:hypothetical protein
MAVPSELYAALGSEKPLERLRRTVERELEAGVPRARLIAQLEDLRADLRASGREDDEDVVLEVMGFLTDWSSPHCACSSQAEPGSYSATTYRGGADVCLQLSLPAR